MDLHTMGRGDQRRRGRTAAVGAGAVASLLLASCSGGGDQGKSGDGVQAPIGGARW
jgi:hypothetical protein